MHPAFASLFRNCVALLLLSGCATLQQGSTRDQALVDALSWDSIDGDKVGFATVYPSGDAATRLLLRGSKAAPALVAALEDPARVVAAHLILTTIYHRDRVSPKVRWLFDPKHIQRAPVGVEQQVNGLRWQRDFNTRRYVITSAELRKNAGRWRQELGQHTPDQANE